MIRQTAAIFLDAYRELNSRRLFWFTLIISFLVVAAFAAVGINADGLTILWFQLDTPINSTLFPPDFFYRFLFTSLGVPWWLGWIATILALVSTAGIIPDMIASGSIEQTLSKPIGRVRLYLTKYASGLIFVALQVLAFSAASFLVLGLRGNVWEPKVFIAVPIVVLFFSYLFSICTLIGLLTRSTIASLLLTLLAWFAIFGLTTTEQTLLGFRDANANKVKASQRQFERLTSDIAKQQADPGLVDSESKQRVLDATKKRLESAQTRSTTLLSSQKSLRRWHGIMYATMTVLPKTVETMKLLERELISDDDLARLASNRGGEARIEVGPDPDEPDDARDTPMRVGEATQKAQRARSVWWIIGTSLLFEAAVLALSCRIFSRRDF